MSLISFNEEVLSIIPCFNYSLLTLSTITIQNNSDEIFDLFQWGGNHELSLFKFSEKETEALSRTGLFVLIILWP